MTPRERLITEIWKADSIRYGVRMMELRDKAEDDGLTDDERREYEEVRAEHTRLFMKCLAAILGKKEVRP